MPLPIVTRRLFLVRAALVGVGASLGLTACGGGGSEESGQAAGQTGQSGQPGQSSQAKQNVDRAQAAAQDASRCTDLSDLTEAQKSVRDQLGYVNISDDPDLICQGCAYWKKPAAGAFCGGCTLMAGPIHPQGYCDEYAEA